MESQQGAPSHTYAQVIDIGQKIVIRIRMVNVYEQEARAYELAGLPVPQHVLQDIERWELDHTV